MKWQDFISLNLITLMMHRARSASPKSNGFQHAKPVDSVELQGNLQQQLVNPDSGRLLPPLRLQADEVYDIGREKSHKKKKKKKKHRKHKHGEDEANTEENKNHHNSEEQQLDSEKL